MFLVILDIKYTGCLKKYTTFHLQKIIIKPRFYKVIFFR